MLVCKAQGGLGHHRPWCGGCTKMTDNLRSEPKAGFHTHCWDLAGALIHWPLYPVCIPSVLLSALPSSLWVPVSCTPVFSMQVIYLAPLLVLSLHGITVLSNDTHADRQQRRSAHTTPR